MQINIDKKSGTFIAIIAGLLVIIGLIAFNRSDGNHRNDMGMHSDKNANQIESAKYQSSDIMFAQMMIPHHEQAVEMSELTMKVSQDSEILELAQSIRDAQAPEIAQMKSWLDSESSSMGMNHDMGGDGMLSEDEMAALNAATGSEFDRLFLKGMIAHHEGAILMTAMIEDAANPEVKTLGKNIVSAQTAEIKIMQEMLKTR
jgi:uncharacterized protein (DUF305 family)